MMGLQNEIKNLASIDIFTKGKKDELFVGRPYYLDFDKAYLLITDAWKEKVGGIPQGTFLLAFYENENDKVNECLLLRVIKPAKLPTDNDVIASMVDYYKHNLKTSGENSQLDDFTKYEFSFSGMKSQVSFLLEKLEKGGIELTDQLICDIAYEFQEAVVEVMAKKLIQAAQEF